MDPPNLPLLDIKRSLIMGVSVRLAETIQVAAKLLEHQHILETMYINVSRCLYDLTVQHDGVT